MKKLSKLWKWLIVALICRWGLWLLMFVPAVNQIWYDLITTPEIGNQLQNITIQIGENPLWQLIFYGALGVPGSCVALAILFVRSGLSLGLRVLKSLSRPLQFIKSYGQTVKSQSRKKVYKRFYLRLIDQTGEYIYDLEDGQEISSADEKESKNLRGICLPGHWGNVVFDMDLKTAIWSTDDLKNINLKPHNFLRLEHETADKKEILQAKLVYCPVQVNWPKGEEETV